MSTISEYAFRHVIPRLSTVQTAIKYKDPALAGNPSYPSLNDGYLIIKNEWTKIHSLFFATDLVGSALIFNDLSDPSVIDAANFVLKSNKANNLAAEAASRLLKLYDNLETFDPFNKEAIRAKISAQKILLSASPLDPLRWCDLSFFYTVLSQDKQAERAMHIALNQSMSSYILRSASRLFFHLNEPDKALHILRNSPLIDTDPLLTSTEIAIADVFDLPTKLTKQGKSMLSGKSYIPTQLGELATVFGSLEFKNGSTKPGKKYFQQALLHPNENIAAQAEWIAPRFNVKFKLPNLDEIPATFEAAMSRARSENNFEKVVDSAEKWLLYQPFSSMPAVTGSFTAATCLRDYNRSIIIAKRGLQSSPDEFMLKNNLAFAYACNSQTNEALSTFLTIDQNTLSDREKLTYTATKGLLCYRTDQIENGRMHYKNAIDGFEKFGMNEGKAIALLFWGLEESRIDQEKSGEIFSESKKLAKILNLPELLFIPELKE